MQNKNVKLFSKKILVRNILSNLTENSGISTVNLISTALEIFFVFRRPF